MANEIKGTVDITTGVEVLDLNANGVLDLASGEVTQLAAIGTTTISATQWGELGSDAYALLAGRSGGQTLIGGTASGNDLTLSSTSHGTKGTVRLNDGTNLLLSDLTNGTLGGAVPFEFSKNDDAKMIVITGSDTGDDSPGFETRRSKGTLGSPTAVANGNELRADNISAQGTGGLNLAAQVKFEVDGSVDANVPTSYILRLNNGSGITDAFKINPTLQPAFPYLTTANGILKNDGSGFLSSSTALPSGTTSSNGALALATGEVTQLANIGATTISSGQWAYVGAMNQGVATTDTPTFGNLTIGNNADVDYILTFDSNTRNGTLTFQEDEANFRFTHNTTAVCSVESKGGGATGTGKVRATYGGSDEAFAQFTAFATQANIEIGGDITKLAIQADNIELGTGVADVDPVLTFNGETNNGVITWMEDEAEFNFDSTVIIDAELGTGDITLTGDITANSLITRNSSESVDDDNEVAIAAGTTGFGTISVDESDGISFFRWESDDTVHLDLALGGIFANTDTDTKFCIYDAGANVALKNRLGSTKTIRFTLNYS